MWLLEEVVSSRWDSEEGKRVHWLRRLGLVLVISLKSEAVLLMGVLNDLSFGSLFPHPQIRHLSSELSV